MLGAYRIQEWLFDRAHGKYDIDLAESGVAAQFLRDVPAHPEWNLDYGSDRGSAELRQAVAALYPDSCPAEQVVVTTGAQEALYLFYSALLRPGDQVITTVPGWQQAWEVPAHLGCEVSTIDWIPGGGFDIAALEALITPGTKLLSLTSPGNPSGRLITGEDWRRILDIAGRHGIWVLCDEEFQLDLGGSIIGRFPRAVSVSGMSKLYGLPGIRIGWAATGSAEGSELLRAMVNHKRYLTISNSSIGERIAAAVLADRERQVARYRSFLGTGLSMLAEFAGSSGARVSLVEPQGTPFAWLNLQPALPSAELARRLLDEHRVLVMPAEVFGAEHGLRVTFARPAEVVAAGLAGLRHVLARMG